MKATKKLSFQYAVMYRSNGSWQKFGTRNTKEEAERLGSELVRKFMADYYKIEKMKK